MDFLLPANWHYTRCSLLLGVVMCHWKGVFYCW